MAAAVDLGSVYATLDLRTKDFQDGIASSTSAMGNLGNTILGVFGGNLLYSAVSAAGRALVGFGKLAVTNAGVS